MTKEALFKPSATAINPADGKLYIVALWQAAGGGG